MRTALVAGLLAGAAGAVLTVTGVRSPVAGALTLVFLLLTPAVCVALLLPGLDLPGRAIVAGAAAVTLCAAVAEIMLVTSTWSPTGGVVAVAAVCAALVPVPVLRSRRKGPPEEKPAEPPEEESWVFEP